MSDLFWIGLLLILGYVAGIVSSRFRLPKITGYILIGIVLSPSVSHLLPQTFLDHSGIIVHFSLSVIAFMIGGSFKYNSIKKLEKSIFSVMIGESQMAFLVVSLGLCMLLPLIDIDTLVVQTAKEYQYVALFLGAISAATAPAAVLAVIHQYKSKGVLTTTLLGVVATDDAIALINFSLVLAVVSMMQGTSHSNMFMMVLEPILLIAASILLGSVSGWLQGYHIKRLRLESSLLISTFGVLLLIYTFADHFHLDGLLTCMAYGVVITNVTHKSDEIFNVIQSHFEEIIFVLFFIISGASVELEVLAVVWPIALLYVVLRISGKVAGSWIGARSSSSDKVVQKYIGLALMPQAGVAIGLALMLYHDPDFSSIGSLVLNTILAATAINEIIGPYLLKNALFKAGEVKELL